MGRRSKIYDEIVRKGDRLQFLADLLNVAPGRSVSEPWKAAEGIVRLMVDPPPIGGEKEGWITIEPSPRCADPLLRQFAAGPLLLRRKKPVRPKEIGYYTFRFKLPAVSEFNRLARMHPVPLKLWLRRSKKGRLEIVPSLEPSSHEQLSLCFLWEDFFSNRGWERLKRCPRCGKWFPDKTKNRSKKRCSAKCTARWWNRSRRREAGHGK
jgi:hypothetical protein